ncbi:hypothetical protein XIS1_150006 [Xenorhabdus innexi]|uniref:Uncharacterized protein n=1 Tax=Xenorhabdus innexi TaxID=290109 RepID=A0A1N6MUB7_9GAMM|nr:hypothetical protein XIS1_150006 [Xenorhabdus innexi]
MHDLSGDCINNNCMIDHALIINFFSPYSYYISRLSGCLFLLAALITPVTIFYVGKLFPCCGAIRNSLGIKIRGEHGRTIFREGSEKITFREGRSFQWGRYPRCHKSAA